MKLFPKLRQRRRLIRETRLRVAESMMPEPKLIPSFIEFNDRDEELRRARLGLLNDPPSPQTTTL